MTRLRWPNWLRRDLVLLFVQRALRSLTQAYLIVIVPIYFARLGFSAVAIGVLFTASAISSALLTAAVGLLADRYGRKLFLILLSLLTALGGLVFALSSNFLILLLAAAVSTVGRGGGAGSGGAWGPFFPAEQALLAEQAGEQNHTAVFSVVSFVGVLAGAIGSLIALVPTALLNWLGLSLVAGDRLLFALTAGLGIVMAIVVLPVRESALTEPPSAGPKGRWVPLSPQTVNLVLRFAATNFTTGLAVGFLGPLLVYWFHARYGVDAAAIGTLFFVINLATAPSYLTAPRLARMLGAVNTVVITRALSVVLLALQVLMPTYLLAAALYLARMIVNTLSNPVRQSYVMGIVEPRERASAAGLSSLPSQVAGSASPALAGYLMQTVSLNLPIVLAAFFQLINTLLYYLFFRHIHPSEEKEAGGWPDDGPP